MFKFTTLTFLSFLISCVSFAQWTQSNGPFTGGVYTLAFKDNLTFAGTPDGVFVSDNNGVTWTARNGKAMEGTTFTHNYDIYGMFVTRKGTLLASSLNGGLLRSTDNGQNWESIKKSNSFETVPKYDDLFFEDGNNLFMIKNAGLYLSQDDGVTWKGLFGISEGIYRVAVKDNHIYCQSGQGLFASHNLGTTWMKVFFPGYTYLNAPNAYIVIKDGFVYASATNNKIYVSKNDGETWEIVNDNIPAGSLNYIGNKFHLYSYDYEKSQNVWRTSTDNCVTWTKRSETVITGKLLYKESKPVFFNYDATTEEISILNPEGDIWTWTLFSKSPRLRQGISDVAGINNILFGSVGEMCYVSADNGASWEKTVYRTNLTNFISRLGKNKIFATETGKVIATEDGKTWKNFQTGLPQDKYIESFQVNILTLYAIASSGEIYRFDESTDSWQLDRKIAYDFTKNTSRIAITANKVFVGIKDSILVFDTKNNTRQSSYLHGKANLIAVDEKVFANNNGSDYYYTVISETGIYAYNQTTGEWDKKIKGLEKNIPSPPNSIHNLQYAKNFLFVSKSDGLFYSKDWGENWQILEEGLPEDVAPYSVFLTNDKIWVAVSYKEYTTQVSANYGVWSLPLKQEFVLAAESEVKDKSNALQLYPNPVTNKLNITYFTQQSAVKAKAQIFNALGQVVSQVSNFQISGDGSLAKEVALSDVPAGRYFIRIEDSGKSVVKSFIKE